MKPTEEAIDLAISEVDAYGGVVFKCPCCSVAIVSVVFTDRISPELLAFLDKHSEAIRDHVPIYADLSEEKKSRVRWMLEEMGRQEVK